MSQQVVTRFKGNGKVPATPETFEAAKAIHMAKAEFEFARRIKDPAMRQAALENMWDAQRKFHAEYQRQYPNGGDRVSDQNASSGVLLPAADWCKSFGFSQRSVQRWADLNEAMEGVILDKWFKVGCLEGSQLNQQSGTPEHYTPPKYIEAARAVLGNIDLDPASCEEANLVVRAGQFFTKDDGGLDQEWLGRVWLNPPYGALAGAFAEKLADEVDRGNVTAAIALVNSHCTDTKWFQRLWPGLLCFTDHRINFYGGSNRGGSTHGSVFVYFGDDGAAFTKHFRQFGPIVQQVA